MRARRQAESTQFGLHYFGTERDGEGRVPAAHMGKRGVRRVLGFGRPCQDFPCVAETDCRACMAEVVGSRVHVVYRVFAHSMQSYTTRLLHPLTLWERF